MSIGEAALESAPPPSSRPAVEVDDLSVSYQLRVNTGATLTDLGRLVTGRREERLVPALRHVSFDIPRGSTLAIIGRNGAGKSTLLRTIAGVLTPETGRVVVRGRVSLLAMGLGFNTRLTGRDNIKLGGLAAGFTKDEVAALTDEIAAFAQLEEYLEYPMSAYSAGMRQRLGFAVAVHLDPEILLIDEALGGGDQAFKEHAQEKMADLMGSGRTIVVVTHGLSSVRSAATHGIWLHHGQVAEAGDPDTVVAKYLRYCRLEGLTDDD